MGSEKTTLRAFGGGVDTSTADPDDEDAVHAKKQFVVTGGDRTITDLGVRLERDLVERLDPQLLETGEERRQLRMHPQQADWADAMYIRAVPTNENRKFDRAVMQYDGYPTVGMPRAWLRNEVVNGIENPFHTAGPEDHVVVRYLPEGAIEIYPEEVFNLHPEFTRLRAAASLVVVSSDDSEKIDCYNLAAATPYDGQIFEIVPFNQEAFEDYLQNESRENTSGSQVVQPTPDEFTRVLTAGDIKPCSAPRLWISWDTEARSLGQAPVLELEDTERFRVVLPTSGVAMINGYSTIAYEISLLIHKSSGHETTDSAVEDSGNSVFDTNSLINRMSLDRINEHWWGYFFKVPEQGPPVIYIPTDPEQDYPLKSVTSLPAPFGFIDHW